MTEAYSVPNSPAAVVEQLGLNLTKEQERKLEDAIALVQQNNNSLEDFLGNTTQRIQLLTAEPAQPLDGETWVNTTLNEFHIRMAGVTRVVQVV
jgi:hypothetical protein